MAVCTKCSKDVANDREVAVCVDCKGSFHFGCLRVELLESYKKLTVKRKAGWKCDSCSQETASNASKSDQEPGSVIDCIQGMHRELKVQISEINGNVQEIKSEIVAVNSTVSAMQTSLSFLIAENSDRKAEMVEVQQKNIELQGEVDSLWLRVHDSEQYSRRDNVEISGIPYVKGENVYELLEKLAEAMDFNFNSNYVSIAHRLKGRKDDQRPPLIVARFISRECRGAWMRAAWDHRRSLTAKCLRDAWPDTPLYVNDHLTPYYKSLFYEARKLVKDEKIASAWTWDSKVFVRVTADRKSPPIQLKSPVDLKSIHITTK